MAKYRYEIEEYGFPRDMFRYHWNGHIVSLLNNTAYVSSDGRLTVHLNLNCYRCNTDSIVRWTFSDSYAKYDWAASLSKLLALYPFSMNCDGTERNSRIP